MGQFVFCKKDACSLLNNIRMNPKRYNQYFKDNGLYPVFITLAGQNYESR